MSNSVNGKTCFNYEAKRIQNYFPSVIPPDPNGWGHQGWKSDLGE